MINKKVGYWIAMTLAGLTAAGASQAQVASDAAGQELQKLRTEMKGGSARKLGSQLSMVSRMVAAQRAGTVLSDRQMSKQMGGMQVSGGYVAVTAYASGDVAALKTDLESKGMIDVKVYGNSVSGRVPVAALNDMGSSSYLQLMRPVMARANVGLVTSEADFVMRSDVARATFGVNGTGVRVGVLSDSFNCLATLGLPTATTAAQDSANNDLPPTVQVLQDFIDPSCSDEGRGMAQLIHDIAPGSPLSFRTAFLGEPDFAAGIIALANAGAKVIVDDIGYFASPMFQDGVIAQAVDTVTAQGVSYFSAAGNSGSAGYASAFRNSGGLHDFNPAANVTDTRQSVTASLPAGGSVTLSFQWDQPFFSVSGGAGSASDVDIFFVNANGTAVPTCNFNVNNQTVCQIPGIDGNVGGDAVELVTLVNRTAQNRTFATNISIQLFSGVAPGRMQYIDVGGGLTQNEFVSRSPTVYGQPNAAGAEAVGAAWYLNTAAAGSTVCIPACAEDFSGVGGTPIIFNTAGQRLATQVVRVKPGITAPDGTNTTFFGGDAGDDPNGFPNFFGTSAAAPHAAAVAALLYDQRARSLANGTVTTPLTPARVVQALRSTASDITLEVAVVNGQAVAAQIPNGVGVDTKTGAGLINAQQAVISVQTN